MSNLYPLTHSLYSINHCYLSCAFSYLITDTNDFLLGKASDLTSFEIVDHSLLLIIHFSIEARDTISSMTLGSPSSQATLFLKIFARSLQGCFSSLGSSSIVCMTARYSPKKNCNDGPFGFGTLIFVFENHVLKY